MQRRSVSGGRQPPEGLPPVLRGVCAWRSPSCCRVQPLHARAGSNPFPAWVRRHLLPPAQCAAGWAERREAPLQKVAAVLGDGREPRRKTAADKTWAAPDAGAVAAAERAMQELLVRCAAMLVTAEPATHGFQLQMGNLLEPL